MRTTKIYIVTAECKHEGTAWPIEAHTTREAAELRARQKSGRRRDAWYYVEELDLIEGDNHE